MLGKAVNLRHCPATVCAPVARAVVYRGIDNRVSAGCFRSNAESTLSHWSRINFGFGKAAESSASQETGPRRTAKPQKVLFAVVTAKSTRPQRAATLQQTLKSMEIWFRGT